MAVKKRSAASRGGARRVRDKWRSKKWYTVRAPTLFNEAPVGKTPVDDPEKVVGRIAESTLKDITGDFSKDHVKLKLRINGTRGSDAVTSFVGHELTSDYTRRFVRRRTTRIDDVVDITTADGFEVRLKPMIVTDRRCQSTQAGAIRSLARETIEGYEEASFANLVKDILTGDLAHKLVKQARTIAPVKRAEVRKSEVVAEPSEIPEFPDIFARPEPEPTPEPEAEPEDADADEAPVADEDLPEEETGDDDGEETEAADEATEDAPAEAEAEEADADTADVEDEADEAEPAAADTSDEADDASEDEDREA